MPVTGKPTTDRSTDGGGSPIELHHLGNPLHDHPLLNPHDPIFKSLGGPGRSPK